MYVGTIIIRMCVADSPGTCSGDDASGPEGGDCPLADVAEQIHQGSARDSETWPHRSGYPSQRPQARRHDSALRGLDESYCFEREDSRESVRLLRPV
jgi:hypothetical protein